MTYSAYFTKLYEAIDNLDRAPKAASMGVDERFWRPHRGISQPVARLAGCVTTLPRKTILTMPFN